jgi:hypothetical protein
MAGAVANLQLRTSHAHSLGNFLLEKSPALESFESRDCPHVQDRVTLRIPNHE